MTKVSKVNFGLRWVGPESVGAVTSAGEWCSSSTSIDEAGAGLRARLGTALVASLRVGLGAGLWGDVSTRGERGDRVQVRIRVVTDRHVNARERLLHRRQNELTGIIQGLSVGKHAERDLTAIDSSENLNSTRPP